MADSTFEDVSGTNHEQANSLRFVAWCFGGSFVFCLVMLAYLG